MITHEINQSTKQARNNPSIRAHIYDGISKNICVYAL